MNEGLNKNEYNPKLGEANRYTNSLVSNPELAKKINEEALNIVRHNMSLLEKLEADPNIFNSHDPIAGSRWVGHYLMEDVPKSIAELYGVIQPEYIDNIPKEITDFIKRIRNFGDKTK
ncbi:MAG TPA: hypothetical protein PLO44_01300 [Candidatus Paceibacterota bacterium]|mgnify:CR=1 FL=1|nr:hypothetical protein [Candidatus Paceibacterota bacterium]